MEKYIYCPVKFYSGAERLFGAASYAAFLHVIINQRDGPVSIHAGPFCLEILKFQRSYGIF